MKRLPLILFFACIAATPAELFDPIRREFPARIAEIDAMQRTAEGWVASTQPATTSAAPVTVPARSFIRGFPSNAPVVRVREQYGLAGDGVTDDTAKLKRAYSEHVGKRKVLYLRAGTYLLSDTIVGRDPSGVPNCEITLIGDGPGKTIIKLKNRVWTDPNAPKAAFRTQGLRYANSGVPDGDGNRAFRNSFYGLTIDTGDNPGAIGIDWLCNNEGALVDLEIKGNGIAAVSCRRKYCGPGLIQDVTVSGFRYGVDAAGSEYSLVIDRCTLLNQAVAHLRADNFPLSLSRVTASGSPKFLSAPGSRSLVVAHECTRDGRPLAASDLATGNFGAWSIVNGGESKGYGTKRALNLPVKDAPTFWTTDSTKWKNFNSQAELQAALNAGAQVVCSDDWLTLGSVKVPATCRMIIGLRGGITPADPTKPVFEVATGGEPLHIIGWQSGASVKANPWISHTGARDVVLRHMTLGSGTKYQSAPGAGNLYLDDVCSHTGSWSLKGNSLWARQLNTEAIAGTDTPPFVRLDNATAWVSGYKTEQTRSLSLMHLRNGSQAEVLGGLIYPLTSINATIPAFDLDSTSRLSFRIAESIWCEGIAQGVRKPYAKWVNVPLFNAPGGRGCTSMIPVWSNN